MVERQLVLILGGSAGIVIPQNALRLAVTPQQIHEQLSGSHFAADAL